MKSNKYEELIERLKRTAAMYYPSNKSDLYSEAAKALEELIKGRFRKHGKRPKDFKVDRRTKKQ